MNPDKSYDLVVVGGGNAALNAAISAKETSSSKRILLVERAPKEFRGGNSKYTRSIRYVHNYDNFSSGPYSKEEYINDVMKINKGESDPDILNMVVEGSGEMPEWMKRHKIILKHAVKGAFHYDTANAFILGGGKQLLNTYYFVAERLGIQVVYDTMVHDIKSSENGVISVQIERDGTGFQVKADRLVVASGGFEANMEYLREAYGDRASNIVVRGAKYNTGIPLKALYRMGASSIGKPDQAHWTAVDARAPKFDGGFVTRIDLIPLGIVVNKFAKRFYDEGEDLWTKRYVLWGHLARDQPDQKIYVIIDSKMMGETLVPMYEGIRADTIEELAKKVDLDPTALKSTVEEYNTHVSEDVNYNLSKLDGKKTTGLNPNKSNWARKLDKPPFYVWPMLPGITFTFQSVRIDTKARVLDKNNHPIENVYAAGEVTSGNIYGRGYVGGTGLVIGTVTGIKAGREAVSND